MSPNQPLTMPSDVRASIHHTLDRFGVPEAQHVLAMLESGRINGLNFCPWQEDGGCACLLGTALDARMPYMEGSDANTWYAMGPVPFRTPQFIESGLAQDWFFRIRPGDTPANNEHARLAADCIRDWLKSQVVDLAPANPLLQPEATAQAIQRVLKEA